MAKKIITTFRLQLEAGKATPAPPVGTTLGQHKLNIMQFVKEYNAKTESMSGVAPAEVTVYSDQSFSFVIRTAPASDFIRKAAQLEKGSEVPGVTMVGTITQEQLRTIAEAKMPDLNAISIEGAMRIVAGTARSMGISVETE